jgi:hypothetical protein
MKSGDPFSDTLCIYGILCKCPPTLRKTWEGRGPVSDAQLLHISSAGHLSTRVAYPDPHGSALFWKLKLDPDPY